MDSKMPKSQEQSEQLQDEELEAIAGGGLDDLVKNLSLRGKIARWAAVAASVVGISVGMAMPAQAINRVECYGPQGRIIRIDYLRIHQGPSGDYPTMCFVNAGVSKVVIADVHRMFSGNNAGLVITNRGAVEFSKYQTLNFIGRVGTVTILMINLY